MAKDKFNLSAAVREAIGKHPKGSAKEIIAAIQKAHPGVKFKETTASVTWSKLRHQGKRRSKRVLKPHRGASHSSNGLLGALDAAQALVRHAGGLEQARMLLDKLASM